MELKETMLSSEQKFSGRIFKVKVDRISLPDGRESSREVVEHPGGIVIAAVDRDRNVFLVEQYRYAMGEVTLELPAGKLEPGEDPFPAAVRELSEETGLESKDLKEVGVFYATPGFCTERLHMYLTTDFSAKQAHPDEGEFLNLRKMPLEKAVELVMSGEIKDGKTRTLLLMTEKLLAE